MSIKRFFKRNSHNFMMKPLAGFGRSLNRLYENRNHDIYSNGELTVLKKLARIHPSVVVDGGANVGNYSIMVTRLIPAARVFSFEPVKATFGKLAENTKGYPLVNPVNKGLYKETCPGEINVYPSDEHASVFDLEGVPYSKERKEIIELISGDEFIRDNEIESVDLLKLDIEGAEYDALLGFEDSLRNGTIKAVQFEYGYINITTKKLLIDYYNFFERFGYRIGKIFPKIVEFREYKYVHEDFLGPNFLAVRNSNKELIELMAHPAHPSRSRFR